MQSFKVLMTDSHNKQKKLNLPSLIEESGVATTNFKFYFLNKALINSKRNRYRYKLNRNFLTTNKNVHEFLVNFNALQHTLELGHIIQILLKIHKCSLRVYIVRMILCTYCMSPLSGKL